jgi:hypothetical protein
MRYRAVHGDDKIEPFDNRGRIGEVPEADSDMPHGRAGFTAKGSTVRLQVIPDDIGNLEQRKEVFLAAGRSSVVSVSGSDGPDDTDLQVTRVTLQPFAPHRETEWIGMEIGNVIRQGIC